jgi:glycosyltransferase 2 family protein
MNRNPEKKVRSRKFTPVGIILTVLGLLLFAYFVKKGVTEIRANMAQLGAGFLLILALGGLRKVVRALAWQRCFEEPPGIRFRDAFRAILMGEALGNIMPFASLVVSEPAKAVFVRERVPLVAGLAAIAVENLFYSLSTVLFIFSGMLALLLSFPLPNSLRWVSIGTMIAVAAVVPAAYLVIHKRWKFVSGALEWVYRRGVARRLLETRRERVRSIEDRIYGFYARNRSRFLPILLLEGCFHAAGVIEVYLTLAFISDRRAPTLLVAFVFESVNRIVNIVFKPVPMRMGVDEGATERLARALKFDEANIGVSVAIIRKARDLFWTAVGLLFLLRRGLSLRAVVKETEKAVAEEVSAGERGTSSALPASEPR